MTHSKGGSGVDKSERWNAVNKFGFNFDIDTGGSEDIWDQGGLYTFLAAAATCYISSDVEADNDIEITVEGLDADWNEVVQTAETDHTDGRTFVALATDLIRVNRAYVSGDTAPTGNIYISSDNTDAGGDGIPDTASNIKAKITAGYNQTLQAVYSVPDGEVARVHFWYANVGRGAAATPIEVVVGIYVKEFGGVARCKELTCLGLGGDYGRDWHMALKVPAKSDLFVRCISTSADNVKMGAGFDLVREPA